ncbi:MAG: leucine-rich repeat domain-containing protein [Paludibacteraceae bacterium]|nr:leucine-rich repeat domain-containing protein [Paludibacteraceae bacterium]
MKQQILFVCAVLLACTLQVSAKRIYTMGGQPSSTNQGLAIFYVPAGESEASVATATTFVSNYGGGWECSYADIDDSSNRIIVAFYNKNTLDVTASSDAIDLTSNVLYSNSSSASSPDFTIDPSVFAASNHLIIVDNGKAILGCALENPISGNITIPSSVSYAGTNYTVEGIDDGAFWGCNAMTKVTIPNSVKKIGSRAFSDCTGLTSVNFPTSGEVSTGEYAFSGCTALNSVDLTHVYLEYGYVFSGCSSLKTVKFPSVSSCTVLRDAMFEDCAIQSITLPTNLEWIGDAVFAGCPLTSIVIPDPVEEIWSNAFDGCPLTSVKLSANLKILHKEVFANCQLTSIDLPATVTTIDDEAFKSNPLSTLRINSYCTLGKKIVTEDVDTIYCNTKRPPVCNSKGSFLSHTATLVVPTGSLNTYYSATEWNQFGNIIEDASLTALENITIEGLRIEGGLITAPTAIKIYNVSGNDMTPMNGNLPAGIYVVRAANGAQKVRIQ